MKKVMKVIAAGIVLYRAFSVLGKLSGIRLQKYTNNSVKKQSRRNG